MTIRRSPPGAATTFVGWSSSRLGRLALLAGSGAPLTPASARELRSAPPPKAEDWKRDPFIDNMRELGEVLRAEEEQREEDTLEAIAELYEETCLRDEGAAIGRVGETEVAQWIVP